ncbi:MAG: nucleotidyltransferase domain-containing protein [Anaerolineae bacterium]
MQEKSIVIPDRRLTEAEIDAELADLVEMLKPYEAQRIVLHGSLTRGDWNRASDIDLIIVKETDLPFTKRISEVIDLCDTTMNVEPLIYTPEELAAMLEAGNSFLEKALRQGKVLYELQS